METLSVRVIKAQINACQQEWTVAVEIAYDDFREIARKYDLDYDMPLTFNGGAEMDDIDIDNEAVRRIILEGSRSAAYISTTYVVYPHGMFTDEYFAGLQNDRVKVIHQLHPVAA